jgi:hypothetical protein
VTKQFRDDRLDNDEGAETPAAQMEKAVGEWLREQTAAGLVILPSGRETQGESILRELKHQPDIKYVRHRGDEGRRGWFYVGVKVKPAVQLSTVSTS